MNQTSGIVSDVNLDLNHYTYSRDQDTKSITSTPSRISRFTYSEYPQIKPTNPLYQSTTTIKTNGSIASRGTTLNTISKRVKYNPAAPRRIHDWRWLAALCIVFFFPTGIIALGLAIKAQSKFTDGFTADAKKLNKRAFILCVVSIACGLGWLFGLFFGTDKWPRTNG